MITLEQMDGDEDWRSALAVVLGDIRHSYSEQFVEVIAASPGQNDGESWIAILRCEDGTFAFLTAWCDYTGWGCQDGGDIYRSAGLRDLLLTHVGDDDRERLGMSDVDAVISASPEEVEAAMRSLVKGDPL